MDGSPECSAEIAPEPRTSRPSLIDALASRARAGSPGRALALAGLFLLALGAVLYAARAVFMPLTLALLLSFVFNPIVRLLARVRIPRELGAALVVLGLCGSIGLAGVQLADPASDWATRL